MASNDASLSVGRGFDSVSSLPDALHVGQEEGFDFVCTPIVDPIAPSKYQGDLAAGLNAVDESFAQSDTILSHAEWSRFIVAAISDWINVDSKDPYLQRLSSEALQRELRWAIHLGVPCIMLPLASPDVVRLANTIAPFVSSSRMTQFWVRAPLVARELINSQPDEQQRLLLARSDADRPLYSSWEWWNQLRRLLAPCLRFNVALELTSDICDENGLLQWEAEPIKALIVPTSIFLTNSKGNPVLSKAHQALFLRFMRLNPQVVVVGDAAEGQTHNIYLRYLHFLFSKRAPPSTYQSFTKGYEDYIEIPLQPLMDNLESQTYETFEKDPIKYVQYQKAVEKALLDRIPESEAENTTAVVMVVGAGRGPLVQRTLDAAAEVGRQVRVYAVEKNPNAVITLKHRKRTEWADRVTVVSQDMRRWQAPEQADILVSELLGSWGDNELSPECLDGAQRFLKPDGISIPEEYTSYLVPVAAHRVHTDLSGHTLPKALETPYVVLLHNHVLLAPEIKPLFKFSHPNPECSNPDGPDNQRYMTVAFKASHSGLMHGFAGYFDSKLYGDVYISIHPETHTPDMFSWFPMFIPLKNPVYLRQGETVKAHVWRKADQHKVWYEWCITSPQVSDIHNLGGEHYFVGL
ncbi:uncharacterized protein MONBRDRAFT_31396 [Monosiga brevicollis MX1]|uniref:Protein arginine N-methyltransferase n=1 Tax=Monosiga brevicollis TaxID=81824 RepID=A9USY0_MONBE|nr:uncharacterized protein MONBRDRAFT_31396 [Monosiga brevicollis MX1]EDQ91400.1 predicted protein [Monosiga brevicollis MX1]|eukprot:XP_001743822.1 hypothetical protein [Monosiga brevicollis MX1]